MLEPDASTSASVPLGRRLLAAEETFTPNDRAVVELLRRDPLHASYLTVEQVAREVGVSKAAVVRCANRLGFRGYGELRAALRRRISDRTVVGTGPQPDVEVEPLANGAGAIQALLDQRVAREVSALSRLQESLDPAELERCVELLADPSVRVHVVGHRSAHGVALHTYRQLTWIRREVRYFHTEELGLQVALHEIRAGDVVLAFAFRRYARATSLVFEHAARVGARTILVLNGGGCPFAGLADYVLLCAADDDDPFDTAVPALFCAETLFVLVIERIGREQVVAHVRQIQSYHDAVELESADSPIHKVARQASRARDLDKRVPRP